jgi:tetratricopeptide (TPR) repeat protein
MRTQRTLVNLITITAMLTLLLLWHNRAAADTLGDYQPTIVRQAQWALQRGNHDHALALLARRGTELRRWGAEAQGNGLICQAWFQKGDYVRAEQACDLAVRAAGEPNGQYLYNRAVMRLLLGRIDEAVADLKGVATMNQTVTFNADFSVAGR